MNVIYMHEYAAGDDALASAGFQAMRRSADTFPFPQCESEFGICETPDGRCMLAVLVRRETNAMDLIETVEAVRRWMEDCGVPPSAKMSTMPAASLDLRATIEHTAVVHASARVADLLPAAPPASAPEPEAEAVAEVVPEPESVPEPEPVPEVVPAPESVPAPEPIPVPEPVPEVVPAPEPVFVPQPEPIPEPVIVPEPEPVYVPEPTIIPEPAPVFVPEPEPEPIPEPIPEPVYIPEPAPVNLSKTEPEYQPEPVYVPEPQYAPDAGQDYASAPAAQYGQSGSVAVAEEPRGQDPNLMQPDQFYGIPPAGQQARGLTEAQGGTFVPVGDYAMAGVPAGAPAKASRKKRVVIWSAAGAVFILGVAAAIFFLLIYGPPPDTGKILDMLKDTLPNAVSDVSKTNTDADHAMLLGAAKHADYTGVEEKLKSDIPFARGEKSVQLTVKVPSFTSGFAEAAETLPKHDSADIRAYYQVMRGAIAEIVGNPPVTLSGGGTVELTVEAFITFGDNGVPESIGYNLAENESVKKLVGEQKHAFDSLMGLSDMPAAITYAVSHPSPADRAAMLESAVKKVTSVYHFGAAVTDSAAISQALSSRLNIVPFDGSSVNATLAGGVATVSMSAPEFDKCFAQLNERIAASLEGQYFYNGDKVDVWPIISEQIAANSVFSGSTTPKTYTFPLGEFVNKPYAIYEELFYPLNTGLDDVTAKTEAYIAANCMVDKLAQPASGVISGPAGTGAQVKLVIQDSRDHCAIWKSLDGSKTIVVYVRGNSSTTLKIPYGQYELRYCYGTTWYGEGKWFGRDGYYCKAENTYNYQSGYSYTTTIMTGDGKGGVPPKSLTYDDF